MPKLEKMPIVVRKKFAKNVKANSVITVAQGDWALVDNDQDLYLHLDTTGAGPCVAIAIHGKDKTLVAHLDDDKNDHVHTRDAKDLHTILGKMLDLVSQDHSKIESIGLLSGEGLAFDAKNDHVEKGKHSDQVLKDLLTREDLGADCVITTNGGKNDLIVEVATGQSMAVDRVVEDHEYANIHTDPSKPDTYRRARNYPNGVEHGTILDLPDAQQNNNNDKADAAPMLSASNNGNEVLAADNDGNNDKTESNNDNDNDNAPPDIDHSVGNESNNASDNAAADIGADMGGGADALNNELDMNEME